MYPILGVISLIISIAMAALIIGTTVHSIRKGGEILTKKNLYYLVPAFLNLYFLYFIASVYKGVDLNFFYMFSLINTVFEVMKCKVDGSLLLPICNEYTLFYVDFVMAYILGVVTVILSFACFFSRRIGNFIRVKSLLKNNCDVVVGDSEYAVQYIKNSKNALLLAPDAASRRYADLIKQGIPTVRVRLEPKALSAKLKKGGYNVIVFRDAKYSYTKVIETFKALDNSGNIIHLEANQQEMKILKEKFIAKADNDFNLQITGFNNYELIARKFVSDYPITKFIPRSFYNDNFTLKGDKQIHVVFIGFGKVNYQLFRMCAMQFQFARQEHGKLAAKPVQYHICDNQAEKLHNEFFSKILFEFDEDFKDCDFPKPEKICELDICGLDINSVEAKKKFKALVNADSFTYFIISLENDLEDASYAQTVKRLMCSDDNYRIFVRARNNSGEKLNELSDRIIYFGEEKKLCSNENIVNNDLTELAQRINLLYNNISDPPEWLKKLKESDGVSAAELGKVLDEKLNDPENRKYMQSKWAALPYIEQASNLYHALNLPFKLNLLGFDMVKEKEGNGGITEAEFNERYKNSGRLSGYKDYSFYFETQSSNVLAFIEHSRWNALYILYDYKQMKKKDIVEKKEEKDGAVVKTVPHKNSAEKLHGCLTTYYGLHDLIKHKYSELCPGQQFKEDDKQVAELSKIYRYDYMDLDRLYSEITAMGYIIVRNRA